MTEKLLKNLIIPESIKYGVKTGVGRVIPVYWDPKVALSQSKAINLAAEVFGVMCHKLGVDVVVGGETGGIGLAATISLKTGLPWAYIRKQAKDYSLSKLVEGNYTKGAMALLVDDVVATASSKEVFIDNAAGELIINNVAVILDDSSGQAEVKLKQRNIELHSLFTYEDLINYLNSAGIVSAELLAVAQAYLLDRDNWHHDESLWKLFSNIIKHE